MTEKNVFAAHPCIHAIKRRAAGPARATAAAAKEPRLDPDGNFRITANVSQDLDRQMRTAGSDGNLQNDDDAYVDPQLLFEGLRDHSTGKRREKTPTRDVLLQQTSFCSTATPHRAGSAASLPQCSDFVGFPWLTNEPAGVLDDSLIAQLALAEALLDVPARRNSRSLYMNSSDYIMTDLLNLAISPCVEAGSATLTDFRKKLRAADAHVRAAVVFARSMLFGGVPVQSTLGAELFWRNFRDQVEGSRCVPATLKKGEQICRVCDITRAKKMLDELKGKTGKDQIFLEGIVSRFKSIRSSCGGRLCRR